MYLWSKLGHRLRQGVIRSQEDGFGPWLLTFTDPSQEESFRLQRAPTVQLRALIIEITATVIAVVRWLKTPYQDTAAGQKALALHRVMIMGVIVFSVCITVVTGILYARGATPVWSEPLYVTFTGLIAVALYLMTAQAICFLAGEEADGCITAQGHLQYAPGNAVYVIGLLAMSTLWVPLRFTWRATAAAAVGSPYVVSLALFRNTSVPSAISFLIAGFLLHGAHCIERLERSQLARILKEATLRCQSEFRVEQIAEATGGTCGDTAHSHADSCSRPETTDTGKQFQAVMSPCPGADALQGLKSLARKEGWLINPTDLEIFRHERLGEGGQGVVVAGRFNSTTVAVKIPVMKDTIRLNFQLLNEVRVLRKCHHTNIATFHGVCWLTEGILVVTEKIDGEALTSCMSRQSVEKDIRFQALGGICDALTYLHAQRPAIVHMDVKPANVMVVFSSPACRCTPKLLDFGHAKLCTQGAQSRGSTTRYAPPEWFRNPPCIPKPSFDTFSFGRLAFFVITARHPLHFLDNAQLRWLLAAGNSLRLDWNMSLIGEDTRDVARFADQCMLHDPASRPTMAAIGKELQQLMHRKEVHSDDSQNKVDTEAPDGELSSCVRWVQVDHANRQSDEEQRLWECALKLEKHTPQTHAQEERDNMDAQRDGSSHHVPALDEPGLAGGHRLCL